MINLHQLPKINQMKIQNIPSAIKPKEACKHTEIPKEEYMKVLLTC